MKTAIPTFAALAFAVIGGQEAVARDHPGASTIARIETGMALMQNIESAGVYDTDSMNRDARTRVRRVQCAPALPGGLTCTYEVNRCFDETDGKLDGKRPRWCQRRNHFVRSDEKSQSARIYRGWRLVDTE
ncbi:hypothetical protein [Sphingomonas koreensis]